MFFKKIRQTYPITGQEKRRKKEKTFFARFQNPDVCVWGGGGFYSFFYLLPKTGEGL